MIKFAQFALAAALVLSVGSFALAQSTPHGTAHSAKAGDSVATKAFKEAHMKMGKDMDIAYSGNTDVDFVRGMIPHHQGAVDMAKVQLAHGQGSRPSHHGGKDHCRSAKGNWADAGLAEEEREVGV